jgi:hypothetical protein
MSPQRRSPEKAKVVPTKARSAAESGPDTAAIALHKSHLDKQTKALRPIMTNPYAELTLHQWRILFLNVKLCFKELHFWLSLARASPGGFNRNWAHSYGRLHIMKLFRELYKRLVLYINLGEQTAVEKEYIRILMHMGVHFHKIFLAAIRLIDEMEKKKIDRSEFERLKKKYLAHRKKLSELLGSAHNLINDAVLAAQAILSFSRYAALEAAGQALPPIPVPEGFGSS